MIHGQSSGRTEEGTKSFSPTAKPALEEVSAKIYGGKVTGSVGPDGAGKTTLMRLMAGLMKLTSGELTVECLSPMRDATKLRELVGYMPQMFRLYEDLSLQEN
jgi:ABC-2 type transport system ATP-binding protein